MKTRDLHVESNRPLVPPAILLEELPLTEPGSQVIVSVEVPADQVGSSIERAYQRLASRVREESTGTAA